VIEVRNLNKKHRLNEKFLKNTAAKILKILDKKSGADISIAFLSDAAIRPINKRYKRRDRATDVLSFNLGACGQILISSDTALKNSKLFNTSFEEEIVLYVIHGILHLLGHEDRTGIQRKRMSEKEESVLKRLCRRNFSKVLTPR
jgi:probable rRNA maturation factor